MDLELSLSPQRKNVLFIAAGLLVGIGLGVFIFGLASPTGPLLGFGTRGSNQPFLVPEIDQPALDFELQTLAGAKIRLADLHGQAVLLNFWATWCLPCREEMPLFQEYTDRYGSELHVLAVNMDEPTDTVQAFAQELGVNFDILLDPRSAVTDLYRVRAFPSTFFLDQEGVIRFRHIGVINERQLDRYLESLGVVQ